MTNSKQPQNKTVGRWVIITLCALAVIAVGILVYLTITPGKSASNYTECTNAGGMVAESFPEQCTINGKTFVNDKPASGSSTNTEGYVGLSEQAALDKAQSENKPARVVKRNGEDLPVDMSYVQGRLNLTINNGVVEKVTVE